MAYTYQEIRNNPSILDSYSYKDDILLRCNHCGAVYHRQQKFVKNKIFTRNNNRNYCSNSCQGSLKTIKNNLEVTCRNCKSSFFRTKSQAKRSLNYFCSQTCNATYQNKNKTHGTNRSKLESWIEEQLIQLYPGLEFHFNRTDSIESELDIYIPSLKLAFEINGIFHYEPVFGNDKLQRTQKNDSNKFQKCIKYGIFLCVIDTSKQKYFKTKTSKKYLDIITNIIDKIYAPARI